MAGLALITAQTLIFDVNQKAHVENDSSNLPQ